MYLLIQLALLLFMIFLISIYSRSRAKYTNLPPGPKGLPLIGFLPFIDKNRPYEQFAKLSKKYGSIMSIQIATTNVIVLNDWKAVKECLVTKSELFSGRPYVYLFEQMAHYDDIFTSDGPRWKEQRRFTLQEMRKLGIGKFRFEDVIMNEVRDLTEHLTEISNKVIPISDLWFMPIMNIIWSSVSGNRFDTNEPKMVKFIDYIRSVFQYGAFLGAVNFMPFLRYVPGPWKSNLSQYLESNQQILAFINEEIEKHASTYGNGVPQDFIDVYLAEIFKREGTDDKDSAYHKKHLAGTVFDMFTAGVETTQRTLEFGVLYMAHWPEIQCKIHEELDSVIGEHRYITYADHKHLPYTQATLLEIHRFSTIIPILAPRTPTVTTQVMGCTIPKGAMVITNLWAIHHDKDYWEDPDAFRPERFLIENGKVKKPEYLIPFSIASRICIGESLAKMELFLFFANILHRFSFHCKPGENLPKIEPIMGISLQPHSYSLLVKQRRRKD